MPMVTPPSTENRRGDEKGRTPMSGICDGRVAIVTGAGRGSGRAHSLVLAEQGAKVVVNDPGGSMEGTGNDAGPAQPVVDEITAMGGEAVANPDDNPSRDGAERRINTPESHIGPRAVHIQNH